MSPFPRTFALLWLVACLALSGEAFGCSFSIPVKVFEPNVVAANRGADLGQMPGPPPVAVQVFLIRRTSSMYACDYAAEFDLVLSWAGPTSLRLQDVGFYVEQVSADGPNSRKGFFPKMAQIVDGKAHLTLRTGDSPPGGVLDFDVDIFAMDRGLRVGPTTRFHVHSNAEPAEQFDSFLTQRMQPGIRPEAIQVGPADGSYQWLTSGLLAQLEANGINPAERCGLYSPYGCGTTETVLLASMAFPYPEIYDGGETKTVKAGCVGVRQPSGRVARLLITDEFWKMRIAAADWVEGTDAENWTRVAATGCQAMMQMAAAREAKFVDEDRAQHDRNYRRH